MKNNFHKVVLVDDCESTRALLAKVLRDAGYQIKTAANGAEALSLIPKYQPHYVLTDWNMPILDGKMLCQCLRSSTFENYMYVILMTGHSDVLDVVEGLGSGADDYITKPINIRELLARMTAGARILDVNSKLLHVAQHDELTGVLNRRNLVSSLKQMHKICDLKKVPVSCIMLDIDRFKKVNDQFGHASGDHVLVEVARRLTARFRHEDLVCRYGGEEFAIILFDCDEAGALQCAERCRREIESTDIETGDKKIIVTASFGVAQLNPDESPGQMLVRADRVLMQAKQNGRNQVRCYSNYDEISAPSSTPTPTMTTQ